MKHFFIKAKKNNMRNRIKEKIERANMMLTILREDLDEERIYRFNETSECSAFLDELETIYNTLGTVYQEVYNHRELLKEIEDDKNRNEIGTISTTN